MDKILIAVPCFDELSSDFAASLAMLNKPEGTVLYMQKGSLIYDARNEIAKAAIRGAFDYIMWFDSDMTFEPDTLERLYATMKERELTVLSGLYFRRVPPFKPVLFKTLDYHEEGAKWEPYNDYPTNGLFRAGGIGFGCVMTDVQVFFDIKCAHQAAWFTPQFGLGEDLVFCRHAVEAGHELWVDPSVKCGHVGKLIVTEEHFKAYKEAPEWKE